MSIETEIFAALRLLVADRVYPLRFMQPDGSLPPWPSIRYAFISNVPIEDLCGDGDDTTSDVRVQIDAVDKTYALMRTLRLQVMQAMTVLPTPARLSASFDDFDEETKTYRAVLDYTVGGSSV
jgi:hypothetical protein